ncbi:MAG: ABC transporter ATP-binding protein [Alphaproteobacteria bacterium]|nr:ABC transporter ATP-binding protein [Alphaproteobacteria bacterium]
MPEIVKLENITVRFGHHVALQDVSGTFHRGSLTAIAGPNGAGKSTLLKSIIGIVKPRAGRVIIENQTSIAYLPQASTLQRDFPLSVAQAACTGFWGSIGNIGSISNALQDKAKQALAEVGLQGLETRQISGLSGGQFQRLLFARAILQNAPLILLDEPFTAVDAETTAKLIQIVLGWHREGRTVICVLHDLLLIQKYFPDSFVLAGKCLGHGHTHKMLEQKLLSFDLDMAELCPGSEDATHHMHDHDAI